MTRSNSDEALVLFTHTAASQLLYPHWASLTCSLRSMCLWSCFSGPLRISWTPADRGNGCITSPLPGNARMSSSSLTRPAAPGAGEALLFFERAMFPYTLRSGLRRKRPQACLFWFHVTTWQGRRITKVAQNAWVEGSQLFIATLSASEKDYGTATPPFLRR